MGFMKVALAIGTVACCASVAHADKIGARGYTYDQNDLIQAIRDDDAFVLCIDSDCMPDKLKKMPKQVVIAMKFNDAQPVQIRDLVAASPEFTAQQVKHSSVQTVEPVSILFGFDSATVGPVEKQKLDKLVAVAGEREVSITGYTCTEGSREYNLKLSKQRAESVADYLRKSGVKVTTVDGKGECCQLEGSKSFNRRVVVQ